jgi:putative DNA primase/helicase
LLAPGVYAYPGNSCWRIVYGRCGINATTTVAQNRTFISTPVAFFRAHTLILSTGLDPVSYRVTHGLTLARAAPPFICRLQMPGMTNTKRTGQRDPISLETAERMLSYVRGVDDRETWVKMAFILKEEFGDPAFEAWDAWSQQGSNYNPRDCRDVWKSCKIGTGANRATVGTLIALAKEGGYKSTAQDRKPIDPEDQARRIAEREARMAAEEAQAKIDRDAAATRAAEMWARATVVTAHPYVQRKLIEPEGARMLGDELLIPLRHGPGALVGLQRIKPDGTKLFLKGTPSGGAYTVLGRPDKQGTVVIAEGWATACSIRMATEHCVVVAFNSGNLAPVARKIRAALPDARMIIAADDDFQTKGNPGITDARKTAREVNALVAIPVWGLNRGTGTDFNDLHLADGLAAVEDCIMKAGPADEPSPPDEPTPPPADDPPPPEPPDFEPPWDDIPPDEPPSPPDADDERMIFSSSPMKTAELFHDTLPERGRIIHWRGEFYSWDATRYVTRDRVYIDQRLYHFMAKCVTLKVHPKTGASEVVAFNPKSSTVNDVAHALRAVCYADLPEPQVWIEQRTDDVEAHQIVAFKNGFLHHPTRTLSPSTDRLFVTSALDFDYTPDAPEPAEWLKFLKSLWPDDPESISTLAEMFGYLLTDDTSQQKMFMLIGPPRCGKGTILRILEALVGYANRVSPSLASLGTQFGLQPLIGKRLAMISDARLSGRADQQPIVENLLRISGEDAITIDRKNMTAWSGKMPTRFVLASNELPAFSDASSALANRFMPFKFNTSFLGKEDHGLTARLLKELPGIVIWALDGLARLNERGYFQRPHSADELAADLVDQTSPIRAFVQEMCMVGEIYQADRDELFKAWKTWCEAQGRDHAGTKVSFGRQLSAAFPGIKRSQPRGNGTGSSGANEPSGTRLNLYTGIRMRHDWESEDGPF